MSNSAISPAGSLRCTAQPSSTRSRFLGPASFVDAGPIFVGVPFRNCLGERASDNRQSTIRSYTPTGSLNVAADNLVKIKIIGPCVHLPTVSDRIQEASAADPL